MIVHVFVANWVHLSPNISKYYITTYKDDAEHLMLLYGEKKYDRSIYVKKYAELGFTNYIFCQSFFRLIFLLHKYKTNAILFHFGRYSWFLAAFILGCKNVNWVCWGSGAKNRSSIKSHIMVPLKKFIYQRFSSIITLMEPDRQSIIRDFDVKPERVRVIPYASKEDESPRDLLCKELAKLYTRPEKPIVLLGNNPTCMNSYINMLLLLKQYKGKIRVQCMLNYSLEKDDQYEKLISTGKSLFGDDFKSNEDFHEGNESYVKYMNTCDVYICSVEKQTGLGAIKTCLKLGKKVYITGKNLEWIKNEFRANVFDVSTIDQSLSYDEFIKPLTKEEKLFNYKCTIQNKSLWRNNWKEYLREIDS